MVQSVWRNLPLQKFGDIVRRVEEVRLRMGLNDSEFARAIGVTLDTFKCVTGPQQSKPSVELVHGVVTRLNVDANWLLNGTSENALNLREKDSPDSPEVCVAPVLILLRVDPPAALREIRDLLYRVRKRVENLAR